MDDTDLAGCARLAAGVTAGLLDAAWCPDCGQPTLAVDLLDGTASCTARCIPQPETLCATWRYNQPRQHHHTPEGAPPP